MRIIYPYNEILPKRKAHDLFIVQECAALAESGSDLTLLIGKGSDLENFYMHYKIAPCPRLHIKPLRIIRKNNILGISWNWPFFHHCQQEIRESRPDLVILSVRKQGAYHLQHKVAGVRYLYEVHELCYYPNQTTVNKKALSKEREMLAHADLITVTTSALKEILLQPPYSLQNRIEEVPLAVQTLPLPPPQTHPELTIAYVGQLYEGQGLTALLLALAQVKNVRLKVIGGNHRDVSRLNQLAVELGIQKAVTFLGFLPPSDIPEHLQDVDAFVAPFGQTGRMPYVAHTKLAEYAEWGRPIIAPDLPVVHADFSADSGLLYFAPGDQSSLAQAIQQLQDKTLREKLQKEIHTKQGRFSWPTRAAIYGNLLKDLICHD